MEGMINQMFQLKAIGIHQPSDDRSGQLFNTFIAILNIDAPSTVAYDSLQYVRMPIILLRKAYRAAV